MNKKDGQIQWDPSARDPNPFPVFFWTRSCHDHNIYNYLCPIYGHLNQVRPSYGGNEAEISIIAIFGGK